MKTNIAATRIIGLLDENSFMECGALVSARSTDFIGKATEAPSDGIITGYGLVDGRLVFVYSQDVSVLNGTLGEMHCKKIVSLYDKAISMGAPVIGMIDCGGLRLQESVDALNGLGEIYAKQAQASGIIPQISLVYGNCGGGMSILTAMSDFTMIKKDGAKVFVNAPNTIPGNRAEICDTSAADFQELYTGVVDFAGSEEEMASEARRLIGFLPSSCMEEAYEEECEDDLNRACAGLVSGMGNTEYIASQIADYGEVFAVKAAFCKEMFTGFIRINGRTTGVVGPNSEVTDEEGNVTGTFEKVLTGTGANKAAAFIRFCNAYDIPLLTLAQATGYHASVHSEKTLPRSLAALTAAFAGADVPKVTLVTGKLLGSAVNVLNSKALGADFVYAWEGAQIAPMEAKLAAEILAKDANAEELKAKTEEYAALQGSLEASARRGYVDLIFSPEDSRKYVAAAFELLYTKQPELPVRKHSTK